MGRGLKTQLGVEDTDREGVEDTDREGVEDTIGG